MDSFFLFHFLRFYIEADFSLLNFKNTNLMCMLVFQSILPDSPRWIDLCNVSHLRRQILKRKPKSWKQVHIQ
jgi:hypothetical protein